MKYLGNIKHYYFQKLYRYVQQMFYFKISEPRYLFPQLVVKRAIKCE